jgi:hypothetical protein
MLLLIRKYQQIIFGAIAAIVIFSMLFFGTFSALVSDEKPKDVKLGSLIDGSPLFLSEVRSISRFISTDQHDSLHPNLCNEGVVYKDFLQSGVADLLIASYFDSFQKELQTRVEKAKKFRFYTHPQTEMLSAHAIWAHFLPSLKQDLSLLREEKEITPKTFTLLSKLYQQQNQFPPETLRRILLLQQQQYKELTPDPKLHQVDLSLFGFHSLNDWFGKDFVDLCSQFILNGAKLAEQKGYSVSLEEAKGNLSVIFENSRKQMTQMGAHSLPSLTQHLYSLGFDLKGAAEVWRKILLFQRYFQGISQTSFLDSLPYNQFASYAKETALLEVYEFPKSLQLKTFDDLIEFQIYLSAISSQPQKSLALPSQMLPLETVAKKFPTLVPTLYSAEVKELLFEQVALKVPLQEIWDWELDEKNWTLLQNKFSSLSSAETRKERFLILERLPLKTRAEIDSFVRMTLAAAQPSWMEEGFASLTLEKKIFNGDQISVKLKTLLALSSQGDEKAKEALRNYSDDGKVVYRIESIESLPQSILSFQEAKAQGILKDLSSQILEAEYVKIRSRFPDKPYSEVKHDVAKYKFSELFQAMSSFSKKEWTDDDYARYRLLIPAQTALEELKKTGSLPQGLTQFQLEKKECKIQRNEKEGLMHMEAFKMTVREWSSVQVALNGGISFFYLQDKHPSEVSVLDLLSLGQAAIGFDAERYVAKRLLESLKLKKSVIIPLDLYKESKNESF